MQLLLAAKGAQPDVVVGDGVGALAQGQDLGGCLATLDQVVKHLFQLGLEGQVSGSPGLPWPIAPLS